MKYIGHRSDDGLQYKKQMAQNIFQVVVPLQLNDPL